jgi:DNA repair exonuclease SbcCD ATPase subunit
MRLRISYTYAKTTVKNAAIRDKQLAERRSKLSGEANWAAVDLAELSACSNILGFKGVRAQVLGHALNGIEQMANYWLTRLVGDGISVKLASYKENAKGNTQESISLTVEGAGGGFGYDGASGGERRRIDVAILFALAEVAANAHGTHGTLFFDEVFDALDQDGMTAVTEALIDLSKDRAVVVISHAHIEDLAKVATARFHIEDGEVVC